MGISVSPVSSLRAMAVASPGATKPGDWPGPTWLNARPRMLSRPCPSHACRATCPPASFDDAPRPVRPTAESARLSVAYAPSVAVLAHPRGPPIPYPKTHDTHHTHTNSP